MAITDNLKMIANNVPQVYDAGIVAGRESEYDTFWDSFQQKGALKDHTYLFSGKGWNDVTFRPKYNFVVTSQYDAQSMFYNCGITDLKAIMDECGVAFDFSQSTGARGVFAEARSITAIPALDLSTCKTIYCLFINCHGLKSVEKLVLSSLCTDFSGAFDGCKALEDITIEGTIARNLDIGDCTALTHDSIMSFINCLADTSTTRTLTLGTTNLGKLTDAEKAIATEKGWTLA